MVSNVKCATGGGNFTSARLIHSSYCPFALRATLSNCDSATAIFAFNAACCFSLSAGQSLCVGVGVAVVKCEYMPDSSMLLKKANIEK